MSLINIYIIKNISPTKKSEYYIKINVFDSIISIKKQIETICSIPYDQQQLIYNKTILIDEKTINYYNIQENNIIEVIPKLFLVLKLGDSSVS